MTAADLRAFSAHMGWSDKGSNRMTPRQAEVLEMVRERDVSGFCHHYAWTFVAGSRTVTREIRALEKKGLVTVTYFNGNKCAVNPA
jgi:hypothetical protein